MPDLDDIPRTRKDEWRQDVLRNPPWGTHRMVSLQEAARVGASTGTSGKPWLTFTSEHDIQRMIDYTVKTQWRSGMRPHGRYTHSWPGGLYGPSVMAGRECLPMRILEIAVGLPSSKEIAADHIAVWELLRPTAFRHTAAQLQIYDEVAAKLGSDLASLMQGASLQLLEASCQFEAPRRRFEQRYGCRLHVLYGTADLPAFAGCDCRFHTGIHINSANYIVQVCDIETGRSVQPGERGTAVVSGYGLDSSTLRYDLEDIVVEQSGDCPCGETGQRLLYLGRAADRAVVDGRMILPLDVQLALEELGAPEFQLRSGPSSTLEIRIESEVDGRRLAGALKESLGVPVSVETVGLGSLPRSTFKPRRAIQAKNS